MTNRDIDDLMKSLHDLASDLKIKWKLEVFEESEESFIANWERKQLSEVREFWFDSFPEMVRVMPRTIGAELVAVQPMRAPSPQIFYMDYISRITT